MSRRGRRPHVPTPESRTLVRRLAGLGIRHDDIARLANISDVTLRKHYPEDLARGRVEANVAVSRSLYLAATRASNPNIAACVFWLKNRAGWKETPTFALEPGGGITSLKVEFVKPPRRPDAPQTPPQSGRGAASPADPADPFPAAPVAAPPRPAVESARSGPPAARAALDDRPARRRYGWMAR